MTPKANSFTRNENHLNFFFPAFRFAEFPFCADEDFKFFWVIMLLNLAKLIGFIGFPLNDNILKLFLQALSKYNLSE